MIKLDIQKCLQDEHLQSYQDMVDDSLHLLAGGLKFTWETKKGKRGNNAAQKIWKLNQTAGAIKIYKFLHEINSKKNFPLLTAKASRLSRVVMEFDNQMEKLNPSEEVKNAVFTTLCHVFSYEHFRKNYDAPIVVNGILKWRKSHRQTKATTTMATVCNRWGAWKFIKGLGIRYCPYCNAESVGLAKCDSRDSSDDCYLLAPALDHYFPRSRYPFLGISLYNLVPSCTRCNSVFKAAKVVSPREEIHPYRHSIAKRFNFETLIFNQRVFNGNPEEKDISVDIEAKETLSVADPPAINYLKNFQLVNIYNWSYKREILDRIISIGRFSKTFIKDRLRIFPEVTKEDIKRLLFVSSLKESEINNDRLSKYTIDLAKQLGVENLLREG